MGDQRITQLTNTNENEDSPVWSPDGGQVVFARFYQGDYEIFKMNADGTNEVRLTISTSYDGQPSWSHDGNKIAFVSNRSGDYLIYTMNPDGSEVTLVNLGSHWSAHPQWSRSDTMIGFDADNDYDGWQELWKINADGTSAVQVADAPGQYRDFLANDWAYSDGMLLFTRITWVYIDSQWYWTDAGIGYDPISVYGQYDRNETTAPKELVPPVATLTLSNPTNIMVNNGDYQSYKVEFTSAASDNMSGLSLQRIEYQEVGTSKWFVHCSFDFSYIGINPCENPPPFYGVGGKTYQFRIVAKDRLGNLSLQTAASTFMVTIESDPPFSRWMTKQELSPYTRGRLIKIATYEEDPLVNGINSRVKYILGEYQMNGGPWQVYYQNYGPSMEFSGSPGNTYCFRFRAVDFALNMEPLKPLVQADCTTLYDWGISGLIRDNREQPINISQLFVQPEPSDSFPLNSTGVYSAYMAFADQSPAPASVEVSFQNPGFGNLPATELDTSFNMMRNVTLPPLDDQVQNGQFENGLFGWKSSGLVNIGANLSGLSGLELGIPFHLKRSVTFTASGGGVDGVVDAQGDFHIVSANTIAIYYRHCTVQGQCDPPAKLVDTGSVISNPKIRQNSKGDLFVIWGDMVNGMEMVRILEKPAGGQWSVMTNLMKGNTPDMLIDSQDNLIVISKENWNWGVAAATRIGSGTWTTGTLLMTNSSETIHHLAYNLSPSGRAYVMFGASCDGWTYNPCTYLFQWDPQTGWTSSNAPIIHYAETYNSDGFPLVITEDPVSHKDVIHFAYRYARYQTNIYLFRHVEIDPETLQLIQSSDIRVSENDSMKAVFVPAAPSDMYMFVLSGTEIFWTHGVGNYGYPLLEAKSPGWMWAYEINGTPTVFWATYPVGPSQIMGCPITVHGCSPQLFSQVDGGVDGFEMVQNSLAFLVRQSSGNGLVLYNPSLSGTSNQVSQSVTLSPNLSNPTISFYYRQSGLLNTPDFRVLIESRLNITSSLQTTELFSSSLPTSSWQHVWRDLTPWAGQIVTLTFQADTSAGSLPSLINLDEISLGSSMPDLQLSGGRVASLLPGETGVYTLTYKNSGSLPAPTAMITVTLPVGLQFAPSGSQPQVGLQCKTWQLGTLTAGSSGQISFAVIQAFAPKTLTTAQITAELNTPVVDPEPGNNSQVFVLWLAKSRLFTPMLQR